MRLIANMKLRLKIFMISMLILFCGIVLEPISRNKVIFAVPFFSTSQSETGDVRYQAIAPNLTTQSTGKSASAPEPATLLLMLGGITGILVQSAKKAFEKIKRAIDIVLSVFGLTITSPILAFAAMLIKLDSKGPIIYKQIRLGQDNKVFEIYKLRSMRQDAEKGTGAVWAKKNDPRITPLGRILRKSRIDEIPQLINVFRGDMSIVGPRPERPEMVLQLKKQIRDYEKRLLVKPGITGLAQVLHKYDESIEDVKIKVQYDLMYINNRNLTTDLRIMAQTFGVVFTGKGAN